MPAQNGGQGSHFLPKTDKQVSHSDSDELTPGSSVRRVINVAYLLGTELCVFSAPPPQKENVDFPEWEHSFFSSGLTITAAFIFFLPEDGEISYEKGCVAEERLTFALVHLGIGDTAKKTMQNCHDNLPAFLQMTVWCDKEEIPLLWK